MKRDNYSESVKTVIEMIVKCNTEEELYNIWNRE